MLVHVDTSGLQAQLSNDRFHPHVIYEVSCVNGPLLQHDAVHIPFKLPDV